MPSFDEVRGIKPAPIEYEEVKGRMLQIRYKGGVDDIFLEEGDTWDIYDHAVYVHLNRDNEDMVYQERNIIGLSCKNFTLRRPIAPFKPESQANSQKT